MCSSELSQERKTILIREYNDMCKDVKCTICLSLYTNPVTLTKCKHTYCLECYKQLFASLKSPKALLCPICKAPASRRGYFVDKALQAKVEYLQIQSSIVASWNNDIESTGGTKTVHEAKIRKRKPRLNKVSRVSVVSTDTDGSTCSSGNGVKHSPNHASDVKYSHGVSTIGVSDVNTIGVSGVNTIGVHYVNTNGVSNVNTIGVSGVNTIGVSDVNDNNGVSGVKYNSAVKNSDILSSVKKSNNVPNVASGVKQTDNKNSVTNSANSSSAKQKNKSGVKQTGSTKRTGAKHINYISDTNSALYTANASIAIQKDRSGVTQSVSTKRNINNSDLKDVCYTSDSNSSTSSSVINSGIDISDDKIIDLIENDCVDCIENEVNIIEQKELHEKLGFESNFTSKTELETGWARLKHMKHNIKKKNVKQYKKLNVSTELSKSRSKKSSILNESGHVASDDLSKNFDKLNQSKIPKLIDLSRKDSHVVPLADFEAYLRKHNGKSTIQLNRSEIDQINQPELQINNENIQSEIDQINRQIEIDLNRSDKQIDECEIDLITQPEIELQLLNNEQNQSKTEVKIEKNDIFDIDRKNTIDEEDIYSICTQKLHFSPPKFSITERITNDSKSKAQREITIDLNENQNLNSQLNHRKNEENLDEIRLFSPELDNVKPYSKIDKTLDVSIPDIQIHRSFEGETIQNHLIKITPEINQNDSNSQTVLDSIYNEINKIPDLKSSSSDETNNSTTKPSTIDDFDIISGSEASIRWNNLRTYKRKTRSDTSKTVKSINPKRTVSTTLRTKRKQSATDSNSIHSDVDLFDSLKSSKNTTSESIVINDTDESKLTNLNEEPVEETPNCYKRQRKSRQLNKENDSDVVDYEIIEVNLNNSPNTNPIFETNNPQTSNQCESSQRNEAMAELKLTIEKRAEMLETLEKSFKHNNNLLSQFSNYLSNSQSIFSDANTIIPYLENIRNYYDKIKDVAQQNYVEVLEIGFDDGSNYSNDCCKRDTEVQTEPLKCPKCTFNFIDNVNNNCEMSNLGNAQNLNLQAQNSNLNIGLQNEVINQNLEELTAQKDVFMPLIEDNLFTTETNKDIEVLNAQKDECMPLIAQDQFMPGLEQNLGISNLKNHQNDIKIDVNLNKSSNISEQSSHFDVLRCDSENRSQYSTGSSEISVRKKVNRQLQYSDSESGKKRKFNRIVTPSSDSESCIEISSKRLKYNSKLLYQDDIDVVFDSEMSDGTPKNRENTPNDLEFVKKLMNNTDEEELKKIVAQAQKPKENTQDITARYISILEKEYKTVQIPQNCQVLQNAQTASNLQSAKPVHVQNTLPQNAQSVEDQNNSFIQYFESLKTAQDPQSAKSENNQNLQFVQNEKILQSTQYLLQTTQTSLDERLKTCQTAHTLRPTLNSLDFRLKDQILDNLLDDINMTFETNDELKKNSEKLSMSLFTESYNLKQKTPKKLGNSCNTELMSASLFTNTEIRQNSQNSSITNLDIILASNKVNLIEVDEDELDKEVADLTCVDESLQSEHDLFGDDLIVESTPQKPRKTNPILSSITENANLEWLNNIAPPPGFQDTVDPDLSKTPELLNRTDNNQTKIFENLPEPIYNPDTDNIFESTPQKPANIDLSGSTRTSALKYIMPVVLPQKLPEPIITNLDTENIVDSTPQKRSKLDLSSAKPRKSAHKYLNPIALAQKEKFSPLNIVVSTPVQKQKICVTPKQKSILNYLAPQPPQIAQNHPETTNELLGICHNFFTALDNSTNSVHNNENLGHITDIVSNRNANTDNSTKTFDFEDKRIEIVNRSNPAQTIDHINKTPPIEIVDNWAKIHNNPQNKSDSTKKILPNSQQPNSTTINTKMPQNAQILKDISNKVDTISCATRGPPNFKPQYVKPVCIASTRLKREETMAILTLTSKLKAKYSRDFSSNVTHLVVSVDDKNRLTDHTIKYVLAISHSLWIVSFRWVRDSLANNQLLPEEPYEALDVSGCCGPKLSRLSRNSHPMFRNYVIHCADPFISVNRSDLEDAIISLGGEIRRSPTDLNNENRNEKICMILSEAKITQDYDQYQMWRETLNVLVVDIEWLSRSVGQYQVANVRPFVLCLEDGMDKLGYPFALVAPTSDTLSNTITANTATN